MVYVQKAVFDWRNMHDVLSYRASIAVYVDYMKSKY